MKHIARYVLLAAIAFTFVFQAAGQCLCPDLIQRSGAVPEKLAAALSGDARGAFAPVIAANSRNPQFEAWQERFVRSLALTGAIFYGDPASRWLQWVADKYLKPAPRTQSLVRVYVLGASDADAFSLPNGMVFVHLGLLHKIDTEGEALFVLAHEWAHTRLGHLRQGFETQSGYQRLHQVLAWERAADSVAWEVVASAGFSSQEARLAVIKTHDRHDPMLARRLSWLAHWSTGAADQHTPSLPVPSAVKVVADASLGHFFLRDQAYAALFAWAERRTDPCARALTAYARYQLYHYARSGKWWDLAAAPEWKGPLADSAFFSLDLVRQQVLDVRILDSAFWDLVLLDIENPASAGGTAPIHIQIAGRDDADTDAQTVVRGFRMGYRRLLIPPPSVDLFDSRRETLDWPGLKKQERQFAEALNVAGHRLRMEVVFMPFMAPDSRGGWVFNEQLPTVMNWLHERWVYQDLPLVGWHELKVKQACTAVNVDAILWTGVQAQVSRRRLPVYHLGIGLVFPPYLPWALYFSLSPERKTIFDAELFEPGGRTPLLQYTRTLRIKDLGDLTPSFSYDLLMQIGNE